MDSMASDHTTPLRRLPLYPSELRAHPADFTRVSARWGNRLAGDGGDRNVGVGFQQVKRPSSEQVEGLSVNQATCAIRSSAVELTGAVG